MVHLLQLKVVSLGIEVVGILVDPISDKPVIIPNTCVYRKMYN
jgi:hypothetical protein